MRRDWLQKVMWHCTHLISPKQLCSSSWLRVLSAVVFVHPPFVQVSTVLVRPHLSNFCQWFCSKLFGQRQGSCRWRYPRLSWNGKLTATIWPIGRWQVLAKQMCQPIQVALVKLFMVHAELLYRLQISLKQFVAALSSSRPNNSILPLRMWKYRTRPQFPRLQDAQIQIRYCKVIKAFDRLSHLLWVSAVALSPEFVPLNHVFHEKLVQTWKRLCEGILFGRNVKILFVGKILHQVR